MTGPAPTLGAGRTVSRSVVPALTMVLGSLLGYAIKPDAGPVAPQPAPVVQPALEGSSTSPPAPVTVHPLTVPDAIAPVIPSPTYARRGIGRQAE